MSEAQQQDIVNWFNKTYKNRGQLYLRPKTAYYVFLEMLKAKKGQSYLDIACGLGRLLEVGQEYGLNTSGIDISDVAIEKCKAQFPELDLRVTNAEALPFEDGSFDLVTCIGSLERMLNHKKVLQEMKRVGKEDCQYCILVRNADTKSWKYYKTLLGFKNKKGHQDAKSLTQWQQLFKSSGFKILKVYPDQYDIKKTQNFLSFGLKKIDYKKIEQQENGLSNTGKFIFILKKK